jgi:hypothetical protein
MAFAFAPVAGVRAATALLPDPVVVVYPLGLTGGVDKEAASRLAVLFATAIAEGNQVIVKPAPPGTERKDYRTTAASLKADYYVTGYVTPIGDEVSVVEQVVSVENGIVVFSNTAQVRTYNDVNGQGEILRIAILRHAARNLGAIVAPVARATPEPTAAPSGGTGATLANLGGLLGRRKRQATPSPSPSALSPSVEKSDIGPQIAAASQPPVITPVPRPSLAPPRPSPSPTATPAPQRTVATPPPTAAPVPSASAVVAAAERKRYGIVAFGGTADADGRAYAAQRAIGVVTRNGGVGDLIDGSTERDIAAHAAEYCATANASSLLTASLSVKSGDPAYGKTTIATLDAVLYGCDGKVQARKSLQREAGGKNDENNAIDLAVDAAFGALLNPPKAKKG